MKKLFILLILSISLFQCNSYQNIGVFKKISNDVPPNKTTIGEKRVTGSDCDIAGIASPPELYEAIDDAISKAPGATALKDVNIKYSVGYYVAFTLMCIKVDAIPVK